MAMEAVTLQHGPLANEYYGTTYPTAATDGTYRLGDIVWNTSPAVGAPAYWVCVAAGAPGTWAKSANLVATP